MNKNFHYSNNNSEKSKLFEYPVTDIISDIDYPIFCFKHIHRKYNISKCDKKHKSEFITRLTKLAELGFKEISKSNRHSYGFEKIDRDSLKVQLPSFITDDVSFLYAYRYNGNNNPFLAYRRPNSPILHIIAIDYNFSVYNHGG